MRLQRHGGGGGGSLNNQIDPRYKSGGSNPGGMTPGGSEFTNQFRQPTNPGFGGGSPFGPAAGVGMRQRMPGQGFGSQPGANGPAGWMQGGVRDLSMIAGDGGRGTRGPEMMGPNSSGMNPEISRVASNMNDYMRGSSANASTAGDPWLYQNGRPVDHITASQGQNKGPGGYDNYFTGNGK